MSRSSGGGLDPLDVLLSANAGRGRLKSSVTTPWGRVRLRDPRSSDASAVHQLLLGVLAEGRGFVALPEEVGEHPDPTFRALSDIDNGVGVGVVAELSGRLVGYAFARPPGPSRLSHVAHLAIALVPEVRGGGVGGALLDALIERATSAPGLRKVSLAVFADNVPAVALYRSRGFTKEGLRTQEVQGPDGTFRDDLLMALFVS